MQLEQLWEYTQVDMEAERFESEMRKAPNRLRLLQLRNFLVEQQANMKKLEGDIAAMADRMDAVRDEASRLDDNMRSIRANLETAEGASMEELDAQIETARKLADSLNRYEQELQKMRKDAETRDRQQKEIRVRAAKSKAEYDQLKTVYDAEFKKDSEKLQSLKARVEQAAKNVDPAQLARYKVIRQHCVPPVAKLISGQCGGCNMSLPSVVLRKIAAGEELVECDNCGRILYAPDGV